jgi:hypothetical protein
VLAYHFARGEVWSKAFDYFCKAGEKATQAFAAREALVFYDQALEVAQRLGDTVDHTTLMSVHKAKADLYLVLSDYGLSYAEGERLLTLARHVGNRMSEGAALATMGHVSFRAHDFDRALACVRHVRGGAATVAEGRK